MRKPIARKPVKPEKPVCAHEDTNKVVYLSDGNDFRGSRWVVGFCKACGWPASFDYGLKDAILNSEATRSQITGRKTAETLPQSAAGGS